jgi:hypothetical protein
MAREAIKDIREVVVEQGWFGQKGGPGEPGTPLNPMYAEVAQDRGVLEGQIEMEPQHGLQEQLREAAARQVPDRGNDMER